MEIRWLCFGTLFAALSLQAAQIELPGKWCAAYRSYTGDGTYRDCYLIRQGSESVTALHWTTAQCTSEELCHGEVDRVPRLEHFPELISAPDRAALLAKMGVAGQGVRLIRKKGTPTEEDAIYERDAAFGAFRPSFNCAKAKLSREKAICADAELSFLDQELSLTFQRAKICVSEVRERPDQTVAVERHAPPQLEKSQADWWANDLAKCEAGDCVAAAYAARIAAVRAMCPAK